MEKLPFEVDLTPEKIDVAVPPEKGAETEAEIRRLMGMGLTSEETLNRVKQANSPLPFQTFEEQPPLPFQVEESQGLPFDVEGDSGEGSFLKPITDIGRALVAGPIEALGGYAKEAALASRIATGGGKVGPAEGVVKGLESASEFVAPEKPGMVAEAVQSASTSLSAMVPGIVGKGKGIKGKFIKGAIWKGQSFGAAEMYDFMNEVERAAIVNGASQEDLTAIRNKSLPKALLSGTMEVVGEIGSDIVSGYIFGLLKNPAISAPAKEGIKSWVLEYAKKTGLALPGEVLGELGTATGEYYLRASEGLAEGGVPIGQVAGVTAIQTALMGVLGTAAGRAMLRQAPDTVIKDIAQKAGVPEELVRKEVSKVEQIKAGYSSETNAAALASIQAAKQGKKKAVSPEEEAERTEWKATQENLKSLGTKKPAVQTAKPVSEAALGAALAKMGGEENAQDVRVDEGQLHEGGTEQGQGAGEGGKDIQQQTKRGQKLAKVKQQAGASSQEEVVKEVPSKPAAPVIPPTSPVQQAGEEGTSSTQNAPSLQNLEIGPIIAYHGSGFDVLRGGQFESGSFFAPSQDTAAAYAKDRGGIEGNVPTTYQVELDFKNPKRIGPTRKFVPFPQRIEEAKAEGFDSIILTDENGKDLEYINFLPEQVRNVNKVGPIRQDLAIETDPTTGAIIYIPPQSRATFMIDKKLSVVDAANKLVKNNTLSQKSIIKKMQALVESGKVTAKAISDTVINEMDTVAYKMAIEQYPDNEEKQKARIEELRTLQEDRARMIHEGLGITPLGETTKKEEQVEPELETKFETARNLPDTARYVRSVDNILYREIKFQLQYNVPLPKVVETHKKALEELGVPSQSVRRLIEYIAIKSDLLTPAAIQSMREAEAEISEGQLYDQLVDEGKSDEEIELILQQRRGASQPIGAEGLTDRGREVLETIQDAEEGEKEAPVAKPKTEREKKLDRIKKKKVITEKELKTERTIEQHPLYLTEEDANSQYEQYRPLMGPDTEADTVLKVFQAIINREYHAGEDIGVYADQLSRLVKKIGADSTMPVLNKQEYLKGIAKLAELIERMKPQKSIGDIAKGVLRDQGGYIGRKPVARHGTDIEDLEGILKDGLKTGSALDFTGSAEWASEYPVIIEVPEAKRGTYVAHNNYHVSANTAMPTKVTIDMGQYIPRAQKKYMSKINELKQKYPNVKFVIKGAEEWKPDIKKMEAKLEQLNKEMDTLRPPTEDINKMEQERDAIMDKYLVSEGPHGRGYNTTRMTPQEREKVKYLDEDIKYIQRQYERKQHSLQNQLDELMRDYEAALEQTGETESTGGQTFDMLGFQQAYETLAGFVQRMRDRQHRTTRTLTDIEAAPLRGSGVHAGMHPGSITIRGKKADPNLLTTLFMGTLPIAEKYNPVAADVMTKAIHAKDLERFNTATAQIEVGEIKRDLSEKEQMELTKVAREVESGETPTLSSRLQDKTDRLREFFTSYRERMKDHKRFMLFDSMNSTEQEIMHDIYTSGIDASESLKTRNKDARAFNKTAKESGLADRKPVVSYRAIESYIKELDKLDKWGIQDYITHAMKGTITIVDSKGRTISAAQTTQQAIDRAVAAIKNDPSIGDLTIEYDHWMAGEPGVKLSKKQYAYVRGVISKEINKEVKEIQEGVNLHVATKALGKVVSIKPGLVYTQFMQDRKDVLPGEENIFDILPTYVHQMEKKMALDPVLAYYNKVQDKLTAQPNLKRMVEKALAAAKGMYWFEDKVVDSVLQNLGITEKAFNATRTAAKVTAIEANLKFGYRPIAGLLNRMSGMGHIWVKTGAKYMLQARKFMRTEEGKRFLESHAADLGTALVEEAGGDIKLKTRKFAPTYLFQRAEVPNRAESYIASYLYGKDKMGYNAEEAREFARKSVWLQQFNYNIAAVPEVFRSPTGRLLFQFKTYLVDEMHFIASLKGPQEWAKYLTMQFILGGPKGMLITLKSLPLVGALAGAVSMVRGGGDWFDDMEQWANAAIPRFYRGMWGFFGIDASLPASFQFPEEFSDIAGVFISDLIKIYKSVFVPLQNGEKYIKYPLLEGTRQIIPVMRYWTDLLHSFDIMPGFPGRDGEVWDSKGKMLHKMNMEDFIKMAGGAMPLSHSIHQTANRMEVKLQEKERAQVASIIEHLVKSRKKFDEALLSQDLIDNLSAYAISTDTLMGAIEDAMIDPETRNLLRARIPGKLRALEERRRINESLHGLGYSPYTFD